MGLPAGSRSRQLGFGSGNPVGQLGFQSGPWSGQVLVLIRKPGRCRAHSAREPAARQGHVLASRQGPDISSGPTGYGTCPLPPGGHVQSKAAKGNTTSAGAKLSTCPVFRRDMSTARDDGRAGCHHVRAPARGLGMSLESSLPASLPPHAEALPAFRHMQKPSQPSAPRRSHPASLPDHRNAPRHSLQAHATPPWNRWNPGAWNPGAQPPRGFPKRQED